jgi:hypothetical protein
MVAEDEQKPSPLRVWGMKRRGKWTPLHLTFRAMVMEGLVTIGTDGLDSEKSRNGNS